MSLNFITSATFFDISTSEVTYKTPVDAAAFQLDDFQTSPSGATATAIVQSAANVIQISWDDDVDTDTVLAYSGAVPSVLQPQTIGYT